MNAVSVLAQAESAMPSAAANATLQALFIAASLKGGRNIGHLRRGLSTCRPVAMVAMPPPFANPPPLVLTKKDEP
jgi:hypothetical protein